MAKQQVTDCLPFNVRITLVKGSVTNLFQETLHTHKLEKEQDQATKTINGYLAGAEENVEQHITLTMNKNLFKNWPLMSSIVLFCIAGFDDMTYMEV